MPLAEGDVRAFGCRRCVGMRKRAKKGPANRAKDGEGDARRIPLHPVAQVQK